MPHRIFGLFRLKINLVTDEGANNNGRYFLFCNTFCYFEFCTGE